MKKIEKVLLAFIVLQPLLDFYLLFSPSITKIFKFSPSTIIRVAFCFIMLIIIILKFKIKEQEKKFMLIYFILISIYMIFHVYNSLKFNNNILQTMSFSYLTEMFYYLRLIIPFIICYITYKSDIKEDTFEKSIITVSLLFSLEIIITNIFKISLKSYGTGFISGNIFDWFLNNSYQFEDLASKGFFYMANQISAVLMLLLPINIYYAIRFSNKRAYISSVCLAISMIMLGTRVATYGWLLVAICMFIAWMFFIIFKKENFKFILKNIIIYIISFSILLIIMGFSPLIRRMSFKDYENAEDDIKGRDEALIERKNVESDADKANFVKNYSKYFSLPEEYILDLYPYENDVQFWINIMDLPYSKRGGNRNLEKLITKRIYELNDNKLDKYFGVGYSRYRNAKIYIESDFTVHYYTIGIFGIILFLFPYIVIATYAAIYMLIKKRLRFKISVLCISIYICVGISFYSGHVLDELIVTIILGFICGYLLHYVKHDKEKYIMENALDKNSNDNKVKLSVIVPVYNVEKYLEKCLDSILNQTLSDIEVIIVNDGTKDNSQKIIDKYKKNYKNIKSYIKENGGLSSARNYGLKHASGKYIAFLDSDDYIDSDMYLNMYNKAISGDFDVVVCDLKYVYENHTVNAYSNIQKDLTTKEDIKRSMISIYPACWNKIYKKSLFDNKIFFKEKVWFEDVEFLYRLYPYINSIGVVKRPFVNYVQRDGAITRTFDKRLWDYIDNWNGIIKYYKDNDLFLEYKNELEYCYVRYLYATFIKRATYFKDKKMYDKAVKDAINNVKNTFPNYKINKYIKKFSLKNIYLKKFNLKLADIMFSLKKRRIK